MACVIEDANGTSGYRTPEVVKWIEYDYTSNPNIWALMCILSYEPVFSKNVFVNDVAAFNYSGKLHILQPPDGVLEKNLLKIGKMLEKDPLRPSATEIQTSFCRRAAGIFMQSKSKEFSLGNRNIPTNTDGDMEYIVSRTKGDGFICTPKMLRHGK
jgi:hypothetical protein